MKIGRRNLKRGIFWGIFWVCMLILLLTTRTGETTCHEPPPHPPNWDCVTTSSNLMNNTFRALAWFEDGSQWRQFDASGWPVINSAGAAGMMQVTHYWDGRTIGTIQSVNRDSVEWNQQYNVDVGMAIWNYEWTNAGTELTILFGRSPTFDEQMRETYSQYHGGGSEDYYSNTTHQRIQGPKSDRVDRFMNVYNNQTWTNCR